jgi:hypothetical protein
MFKQYCQGSQERSPCLLALGQRKKVIDPKTLLASLLIAIGMWVLMNSRVFDPQSRSVGIED